MNTTHSSILVAEIPGHAKLQREMHDALRAQHPEWVQSNGDSPICDAYESRFAELLSLSLQSERAFMPAMHAEARKIVFPRVLPAGDHSVMKICYWRISRCLLAGSLCGIISACGHQAAPRSLVKVEAQRVQLTETAKRLTLTGEIRAQVESDLAFRVSGRITERLVDVGDHVSSGQILAKLDPHEQQATVELREAEVRAAEAGLRNETSNLARQKFLLSRKSAPQSEYDRAEESFRTAQSALEAANAHLGTARDALAQTELRADNAGTITTRNAEIGQVMEGAQPVFVLAHDGPRDAVFNVSQSVLGNQPIDRSIPIAIILGSDPSIHTTGKVHEVTPTLSGAGGTLAVKVRLDDSPQGMTLGAAVVGEGPLSSRKAITLPPGSLASVAGQPAVWIVDPATRTVSARPITIARYETSRVVVAAGLRPGELVVTRDGQKMSPQQSVAIAEVH